MVRNNQIKRDLALFSLKQAKMTENRQKPLQRCPFSPSTVISMPFVLFDLNRRYKKTFFIKSYKFFTDSELPPNDAEK